MIVREKEVSRGSGGGRSSTFFPLLPLLPFEVEGEAKASHEAFLTILVIPFSSPLPFFFFFFSRNKIIS